MSYAYQDQLDYIIDMALSHGFIEEGDGIIVTPDAEVYAHKDFVNEYAGAAYGNCINVMGNELVLHAFDACESDDEWLQQFDEFAGSRNYWCINDGGDVWITKNKPFIDNSTNRADNYMSLYPRWQGETGLWRADDESMPDSIKVIIETSKDRYNLNDHDLSTCWIHAGHSEDGISILNIKPYNLGDIFSLTTNICMIDTHEVEYRCEVK